MAFNEILLMTGKNHISEQSLSKTVYTHLKDMQIRLGVTSKVISCLERRRHGLFIHRDNKA